MKIPYKFVRENNQNKSSCRSYTKKNNPHFKLRKRQKKKHKEKFLPHHYSPFFEFRIMSSFETSSSSTSASASAAAPASTAPRRSQTAAPAASSSSVSGASSTQASAQATESAAATTGHRLPSELVMKHAVKFAIEEDKPIMMDYWIQSLDKSVLIGVRNNNEKLLVKSEEEYTSTIHKFKKIGSDLVVITENSIYLVSGDIPIRKIS